MMRKKVLTSKRSLALVLIQSMIPVVFIAITILIVRTWEGRDLPPLELSLNTYKETVATLKFNGNLTGDAIETKIFEEYQKQFKGDSKVELILDDTDINDYYLGISRESLIRVNKRYLYGATVEPSLITMHFNNRPYHSTPISLGLIHNAILRAVTGKNIGIKVTNKPLAYRPDTMIIITNASNSFGFQLSFNIGFAMSFVASLFVIYYVKERKSKVS
jgi:ATP-binding cassette subfamily A (ABC1) protein 3